MKPFWMAAREMVLGGGGRAGLQPGQTADKEAGFSHGETGLKPASQASASARLKPCPSTPAWLAHALWIVPAILVFAPTIHWLWQRWTMSVWHNVHGLFIPFIVGYLIYKGLRSDPISDVEQAAWGFLFLIPGLALIVLDSAIRTQLLAAVGVIVCLPGLSLLLLGSRRAKSLAFAWVLAFFMLPIPATFMESFILLLRRISAVGAEHLVALCGVPIARQGTFLFMPRATMSVVDACSGFSVLYASFTLALLFAYLTPSWPRRVLMLLAAFPVAIACNIVRQTALALMVERWGPGILETFLHPASGMLTFFAAAALLTFLGTRKMRGVTA